MALCIQPLGSTRTPCASVYSETLGWGVGDVSGSVLQEMDGVPELELI